MKHYHLLAAVALLSTVHAEETAPQQVIVAAARSEQRQQETVATTIVGRDELLRHGDQSLAQALQRLPGISISSAQGNASTIQMRGLGKGYTQILLNGEPVPAGFSIDSLQPEMIERIEIMRSTTAELSNQAIAGSINIVLRKAAPRPQRSLGGNVGRERGLLSPTLSAQLSGRDGGLGYTLAATFARRRADLPFDVWEEQRDNAGQLQLLRRTLNRDLERSDQLTLAPRLNWTLAGGDTLAWQSFLDYRHIGNAHIADETVLAGTGSEFPHNTASYVANATMLRSDLQWQHRLSDRARLEMKLGYRRSRRGADFDFLGRDTDLAPNGRHYVASGPAETGTTISGAYRLQLDARHTLAAGWDLSQARRSEYRNEQQFDAAGALSLLNNASYSARVRKLAFFAQDEWEIDTRWSLYAGLRRESLRTASDGSTAQPLDNEAAVWSPSLQARYKPDSKQVLRLALNRTYKAPPLSSLVPRRYTTDNNNNPNNPAEQGNPQLRPELAWGLDAAWEYYPAPGSLLSASAYARRIRDVTQTLLFQQEGEWIETPFNNGNASVHGIELEAKLPVAGAVDLRANAARNWSAVDKVAGPYNSLEQQLPWTANLGLDYRASPALTVGGNLNLQSGGTARLSPLVVTDRNIKRGLDAYVAWKADGHAQVRMAAANLFGKQSVELRDYRDGSGLLRRTMLTPQAATLRLSVTWQY
ncbi:TonB-dependent receptor plug domain-containing protein [Oxalobacteraceae bacterium A2-2]